MAFENEDRITKYQNNKVVWELNDHMFPAPVECASEVHAGYSKIFIVAVDTSKGKGKSAVVLEANVDPIKVKRLYEKVSRIPESFERVAVQAADGSGGVQEITIGMGAYKTNTPTEALLRDGDKAVVELEKLIPIFEKNAEKYAINKKKIEEINAAIARFKAGDIKPKEQAAAPVSAFTQVIPLLVEKKINPSEKKKNENDEYPVTVLQIEFNPKMRNPFTVYMENGWAKKEIQAQGGTAIKGGTYRKEKEVKIVIDEEKFREIVREANDAVVDKERQFRDELKEQLKKYKEDKRKKAVAAADAEK